MSPAASIVADSGITGLFSADSGITGLFSADSGIAALFSAGVTVVNWHRIIILIELGDVVLRRSLRRSLPRSRLPDRSRRTR